MSKNIFVVTTETYSDGDYTLDIEGTFSNKLAAKKEMKLCADDYIEEYGFSDGEYKIHNDNNTIILKSNISNFEMRISTCKTTLDESNFE